MKVNVEYVIAILRCLLGRLCKVANIRIRLDQQIGFHPIKMFRSLTKHGIDALISNLFQHWPASEQNPFVLPVALSGIFSLSHTDYLNAEFMTIAMVQFSRQWPAIPLLTAAILLCNNSEERVRAVRRLVAAGVDTNAITPTAALKEFISNEHCAILDGRLFSFIEESTALALAVAFDDHKLAHTLLELGADACLVHKYY